jgi:RNA polymerase sigma factor (TIGR02999 family)
MSETTQLLQAIGDGDTSAAARLLPIVYQELRRIARSQMSRERAEHTLQATALVHEAYLRLFGNGPQEFDGRRHFFAVAAEAMRRILIEHARRKNSLKQGGAHQRVAISEEEMPHITAPCDDVNDLLALNEALDRLEQVDPSKAELVKLLYFAALSLDEAAEALGMSRTTAYRQWTFARAWLFDAIGGETRNDGRADFA